eukprot:3103820-Pyramimonas_sp.AAC.1
MSGALTPMRVSLRALRPSTGSTLRVVGFHHAPSAVDEVRRRGRRIQHVHDTAFGQRAGCRLSSMNSPTALRAQDPRSETEETPEPDEGKSLEQNGAAPGEVNAENVSVDGQGKSKWDEQNEAAPGEVKKEQKVSLGWSSLPIAYGRVFSKTDARFLKKKTRKRWWKRGDFPRVRLLNRTT